MNGRTHFVVVRHGETRWNLEQRIQGQGDSPLTGSGRAQAEAIARRLAAERPFDRLVSSDLGRALDTARAIAAATGQQIRLEPRLRERHFGAGEGLTYDEVGSRYPGAFRSDGDIDPDYAIPGGESRRQFHERVALAFEELAAANPGARLVVVTHGGVLATLYRHIRRIPLTHPHRIAIGNASYNAVSFAAGAWALHAWADAAHLDDQPPFEEA
ncbi:MAG TPA: histidine phosphatase family protein [Usitatibacter sp.]|nr:histidine phosphatase family protein [Usitatibacter sp.]